MNGNKLFKVNYYKKKIQNSFKTKFYLEKNICVYNIYDVDIR